ncbi:MAG: hypothetical protein ABJE95_11400 [Byssovorax sp.]
MRLARWIPIVACAALFVACSSTKTNPGPPPPCPACMSAGALMVDPTTTSTGAGGAPSKDGGHGGGDTVTVTGDVATVNNLNFDAAVAYAKPATVYVYAYGTSGQELSQPYNGTTFSIDNVSTGESWFRVLPKDTTDTVFPTYSVQNVGTAKLQLPLLDKQILTTIGLDAGLALADLDAQIVIAVSRGGKPLSGIKAESLGAGEIVYDFAPSSYSKQNGVTGDRGIIILINMSATSITLTDTATKTTYHPVVRPDPGTATLLGLEL